MTVFKASGVITSVRCVKAVKCYLGWYLPKAAAIFWAIFALKSAAAAKFGASFGKDPAPDSGWCSSDFGSGFDGWSGWGFF